MVDLLPFPSPQQLDQEPVIRIKWYVTHFKENQLVFIYLFCKKLENTTKYTSEFRIHQYSSVLFIIIIIIIIINNVSILTLKPGRLYFCL